MITMTVHKPDERNVGGEFGYKVHSILWICVMKNWERKEKRVWEE